MRNLTTTILCLLLAALPSAGQLASTCDVPVVPLTTHPDRPVPRDPLHRYHDDWRNDRWVVRLHGNTRADTVDTIRAPYIDEWTPLSAPHRREPLMSPDQGWEMVNNDQTWAIDQQYRQRSATYLFYNKYSGRFRPLMFFREPSTLHATHYAWAASTLGLSTALVSGVVHSPMDREAVDSNLWTSVEVWGWHALPTRMRYEPNIWVSGEFEAQYDPCHCDLKETQWFNFHTALVEHTTIDGKPATIERGPFLYHGIATYLGGHDTNVRPPGTSKWVPYYDAPFGTWTLLRTPGVVCSISSDHSTRSDQGAVTMRMRTTDALLGVVNPHVFDVDRQVPARLAYVLCIRGSIDDVIGMRRLNDTLWVTDEIDAQCSNGEVAQVRFTPRADVSYGPIRLAVTPTLTPRDLLARIRSVETTSVFATRTMFMRDVATTASCNGWRLANEREVSDVCAGVDAASYKRRERRSYLPSADTATPPAAKIIADVLPNPVRDLVVISLQQPMDDRLRSIEVVDVQGKRVRYEELFDATAELHRQQIDVSSLTSGVYQIIVRTNYDVAFASVVIVR